MLLTCSLLFPIQKLKISFTERSDILIIYLYFLFSKKILWLKWNPGHPVTNANNFLFTSHLLSLACSDIFSLRILIIVRMFAIFPFSSPLPYIAGGFKIYVHVCVQVCTTNNFIVVSPEFRSYPNSHRRPNSLKRSWCVPRRLHTWSLCASTTGIRRDGFMLTSSNSYLPVCTR